METRDTELPIQATATLYLIYLWPCGKNVGKVNFCWTLTFEWPCLTSNRRVQGNDHHLCWRGKKGNFLWGEKMTPSKVGRELRTACHKLQLLLRRSNDFFWIIQRHLERDTLQNRPANIHKELELQWRLQNAERDKTFPFGRSRFFVAKVNSYSFIHHFYVSPEIFQKRR